MISIGKQIMNYERTTDKTRTQSYSFEKVAFGELNVLCMNTGLFSSEIMMSRYDTNKHDLSLGFIYDGSQWIVSLRSDKVDVSLIARERGGGGHAGAARFIVEKFEDIFI